MPFQKWRKYIFHWCGRAWLTIWNRVKIPQYSHKLMHRKRVTCELHDSYFRSMIKTCHSKGVGIELLHNSVHRKFNQFGDQTSWRQDAVEKASTQQREPSGPRLMRVWGSEEMEKWCCRENSTQQRAEPLGLQLSSPGEWERNAVMANRVEVNMLQFCSVSNSLSHTTLSNKRPCRSSSLLCWVYNNWTAYKEGW